MQNFFISDLHFRHRSILHFSPNREGDTIEEHDHAIIVKWNSKVTKRDRVFVLGDVAFDKVGLEYFEELNGRKILVRGNHDKQSLKEYLRFFEDVQGMMKYKGYWVTHCPMHPNELFGKKNIHGHVHNNIIRTPYGDPDPRYIPVCVEQLNGYPISFDEIKKM